MHCYQLGDVSRNHSNECAGDIGSEVKARTAENGNILLAHLASTDLLVGLVSQSLLITALIFLMTDSFTAYCNVFNKVTLFTNLSVIASAFHLALISIDRNVAMKHALRYESIVTKSRVIVAVI